MRHDTIRDYKEIKCHFQQLAIPDKRVENAVQHKGVDPHGECPSQLEAAKEC